MDEHLNDHPWLLAFFLLVAWFFLQSIDSNIKKLLKIAEDRRREELKAKYPEIF